MRQAGLRGLAALPRPTRTTDSRHAYPIAPNRLGRNFVADRPSQVWLADLTYIATGGGWLYLAAVLDLHTVHAGAATVVGQLRAAWLRSRQTDLVPDKGQFRLAFPPSAQLLLSDNDFSGSAQPTPTSFQRNTSGRAGWNGWARCGRDSSGGGVRMLVMAASVMRRLSLNRLGAGQKSGQNIPKNRCRTTIAERMVETRAELPFIGDQIVCLSHDKAARS